MSSSSPTPVDPLEHLDLPPVSDSSDTEEFLQELAALNDAGLLRATVESLECGRLTPLIKEELRCRIQSRRLSEGKEELLVEFPSPTPTQPRPDEVEKRDRRREQNRRAAQKFRKRKKERGDHLIEETQRLETHNTTLLSEIRQLNEEKHQLARIIQSHASICPLTPRQSPLTVIRESPLPHTHPIRESPLPPPPPPPPPPPQPSSSTSSMSISSPVRKSPMLTQQQSAGATGCTCGANSSSSSSINNISATSIPTGGNTRAVILLPPSGESSTGFTTPSGGRLLMASPIHMSGRPRKSPVPRVNQSPVTVPGEKSPVPLGSPRKQNKHANSLKLNLPGPKPVKPILPKGSLAIIQSCTSPKTPLGIITSPLPVAHSPVSFVGRGSIHQSPVFFSDDCYNAGHRSSTQYPSQSPVSFTDSNSTPGHQVTQSPVFFAEKSPGLGGNSCHHFFQPSSASSSSSTSSLASLLRQESPSSVLSSSSILSTASSIFFPNSSSFNSNANNNNSNTATGNVTNANNNSVQNMVIDGQSNTSAFLPSNDAKSSSMNEINTVSRVANWDTKPPNTSHQTPLNESNHFLHKSSTQLRSNTTDGKYGDASNSPNLRSLLENRKSTGSILEQALTRQTQNVSFANRYRTPPSLTPTPTDFPPTFPINMDTVNMGGQDYSNLVTSPVNTMGASGGDGCPHEHQQQQEQQQQFARQNARPIRNQPSGFTSGLSQQMSSMIQTQSSMPSSQPSSSLPQSNSLFASAVEDNVLSVEDIERSVSEATEAVDPLLDFIDIQELLELSSFHSPNSNNGSGSNNENSNNNSNDIGNAGETCNSLTTSINCNDILNANYFSMATTANNNSGNNVGGPNGVQGVNNPATALSNYFGDCSGTNASHGDVTMRNASNSGGTV